MGAKPLGLQLAAVTDQGPPSATRSHPKGLPREALTGALVAWKTQGLFDVSSLSLVFSAGQGKRGKEGEQRVLHAACREGTRWRVPRGPLHLSWQPGLNSFQIICTSINTHNSFER